MKSVMCFGAFDVLHLGHVNYFTQAKEFGDYLIVVVARDHTKEKMKKPLMFSENERVELVKSVGIVDEAVLGDLDDHFKIILDKKPSVICLGYDQEITRKELGEELSKLGLNPIIKRMKPYGEDKYKSSKIKK